MIQVTAHMRILVATHPISLRNRIDGTSAICRNVLDNEPYYGTLFVIINRRKTMIRLYMMVKHERRYGLQEIRRSLQKQ